MSAKASRLKAEKVTKKVTLRDIAEALGVSKATVSLSINGSSLVAEKTRKLVLEKIEELGYVYNRGAASLATGRSGIIGLAIHDFTNPYFTRVCASIEASLSLDGRMAFLCNSDESLKRQTRFIRELSEHNADGLILCPVIGTKVQDLSQLTDKNTPIVLIARDVEDAELDFVGNDDFTALRMATEHMIGNGHRRIGMLGGANRTSVSRNRRKGFLTAMEEAGLEVDPSLLVDCEISPEGGEAAMKEIVSRGHPPTAVVCFSDLIGLGALSALHELGLKPGSDIAVIGCDGIAEAGRSYVQLSTVNVQKAAIGQEAADLLSQRLENPTLPARKVVLEPQLVIRTSCGTSKN